MQILQNNEPEINFYYDETKVKKIHLVNCIIGTYTNITVTETAICFPLQSTGRM